jgi:hypothetical protein
LTSRGSTRRYARDRFAVTFGFTAFGITMRQVVQGRVVEPAA